MYREQRLTILSAVAIALLTTSGTATTVDLGEEMEAVRNQVMEQGQGDDSFSTQSRGGVSGGSYSMRNPTTKKQPWYQIQTPQIDSGCQGTDIFGGSMSFMSADQLRSQLQNMAGPQVVTYALGVALDVMAPTLSSEMKRLQRLMNQWNESLQDDCRMAQTATELSGLEGMAQEASRDSQGLGTELGEFNDEFEAHLSPESKEDGNTTEQERQDENIAQNIMWEAMKEANLQDWTFPGGRDGDASFREFMMNLTGTVVLSFKDEKPDTDPQGPRITPEDLIKGFEEDQQLLTCPDDACLEPQTETVSDFEGMEDAVLNSFFLGDGGRKPLYEHFQSPGDEDIADSQKALIHLARTPTASLMRSMAIEGNPPAAGTPEVLSRRVAFEIVNRWVSELYLQAEEIALNHNEGEEIIDKLRSWREMSMARMDDVRQSLRDDADFYGYYNEVQEALGRTSDLETTRTREIMQQN